MCVCVDVDFPPLEFGPAEKKTRHDFSTCSRDLSDDYSPLSLHYGVDEEVLSLKRVVLEERDNPARSTNRGACLFNFQLRKLSCESFN